MSSISAQYISNLVSIIMPAHNAEKTIKESIESVLCQSYSNWELIVVLDNCNDNTRPIVQNINDLRINLLSTQNNQSGAAGARNLGIRAANGQYIAFLDSDDIWLPNKLQKQIGFMKSTSDCYLSYTDYYVFKDSKPKLKVFKAKSEATYSKIIKSNYIGCSTVVYDATINGKIFMPEAATKREDFAAWLYCLRTFPGRVLNVGEPLMKYGIYEKSVSRNKFKMLKPHWNVLRNVEKLSFFKSLYFIAIGVLNKLFKGY